MSLLDSINNCPLCHKPTYEAKYINNYRDCNNCPINYRGHKFMGDTTLTHLISADKYKLRIEISENKAHVSIYYAADFNYPVRSPVELFGKKFLPQDNIFKLEDFASPKAIP